MTTPSSAVPPPRMLGREIVGVVEAYGRQFPDVLPMFHAADVLPLLEADDRAFAAASTLLDAERVYYPEGTPE